MPNRSGKPKRPRDINQLAAASVDEATSEKPISAALRQQINKGLVYCGSCRTRIEPAQPRTWRKDTAHPEGGYVLCNTCKGRHAGKQIDEPEKNPHAQALGRLGGLKGGKARAAKLSPEQRREIARKAAKQRWGKKRT